MQDTKNTAHYWILCEKCENYIFPEGDQDGFVTDGCKHPKVVSVFGNFHRKYKCKYFKKISRRKMKTETLKSLRELKSSLWRNRDQQSAFWKRFKYIPRKKVTPWKICLIKYLNNIYLDYRDFLFLLEGKVFLDKCKKPDCKLYKPKEEHQMLGGACDYCIQNPDAINIKEHQVYLKDYWEMDL